MTLDLGVFIDYLAGDGNMSIQDMQRVIAAIAEQDICPVCRVGHIRLDNTIHPIIHVNTCPVRAMIEYLEEAEDEPTDTGEDGADFLAKIAPYQQRAKDENLEITFHIFAEGGYNDWDDDPTKALALYRDHVQDGKSCRLWVELYKDRKNDDMETEDHILGFGSYPT